MKGSALSIDYSCPVCGVSSKYDSIASISYKYLVVKCNHCTVEFIRPLPSIGDLFAYYNNYDVTQESEHIDYRLAKLYQRIINYLILKIVKKDPCFLEYGFGKGAFLKQISLNGFAGFGIELNKSNCQNLQRYCKENNLEIKVLDTTGDFLDTLPKNTFDIIVLFQIIEHIVDPLGLLLYLYGLQKPGGILYLECPNNDALYLKLKNLIRNKICRENFYNSLSPPRHLYGFNRKSIKILLERSGYAPVEVDDYFFGDGIHQIESIYYYPTFLNFIKDKNLWNLYGVLMFLARLLDPLASKLFMAGGGLYALARKE